MARVIIYTANYCPYCRMAETLLHKKGIAFENIDVTEDQKKREWLVKETGYKTVPQIFIDGQSIGGFQELSGLDREGKLNHLTK